MYAVRPTVIQLIRKIVFIVLAFLIGIMEGKNSLMEIKQISGTSDLFADLQMSLDP